MKLSVVLLGAALAIGANSLAIERTLADRTIEVSSSVHSKSSLLSLSPFVDSCSERHC